MDQDTQESKPTGTHSKKRHEIQKVETQTVEAVTPNQLLQIAIEKNADLDRLDKLMELQMKWEANQARKLYVEALSQFRAECPPIPRTVKGYNTNYAGLAATLEIIKEPLSNNGLSHTWRTQQADDLVTVTCRLTHQDGHYEETSLSALPDKSGNKNSIQAIGSTVSYLERYTLFALLGLASQDMDDDGAGAGDAPKQTAQQKGIEQLIKSAWLEYCQKNAKLISADKEISLEKFKEALRKQYGLLPELQKARFEWKSEHVAELVKKININNVIAKKPDDNTEGQ